MITHLHTLKGSAKNQYILPFSHSLLSTMLAYQAHVAQSHANKNIKPMQQECSLSCQNDPSCSSFLTHHCKIQKESEKSNQNVDK